MPNSKKQLLKLTDKQKNFIKVYRKYAGNLDLVCKELSISTAGAQKYLSQDKVKEELNKSIQITRQKIDVALPYLIDVAINMINSENVSEKVKSQLVNSLLDRGGIVQPKSPSLSININTEISERARKIFSESLPTLTDASPVTISVSDNQSDIT